MYSDLSCIVDAFHQTLVKVNGVERMDNKQRSSLFINEIHQSFEKKYPEKSGFVVFSKGKKNLEFRRNEYLFDILIGKKEYLVSAHKHNIPYVSKAYLCIESEFAENNRESVIDINKLLLAHTDNRIMILPMGPNIQMNYLNSLKPMLTDFKNRLIIMFFPHPKNWMDDTKREYRAFEYAPPDSFNPIEFSS